MIQNVIEGAISIGGQFYDRPIALTTESVIGEWGDKSIDELSDADFAELLQHEPELIVLGTGVHGEFAPRELVFALARRGIGLEVMDTGAAARTFNVLAAEGRKIAAVLY